MRINRLNTESNANSTLGKIKELTIYHVLKNQNTNNGKNNSYLNTNANMKLNLNTENYSTQIMILIISKLIFQTNPQSRTH